MSKVINYTWCKRALRAILPPRPGGAGALGGPGPYGGSMAALWEPWWPWGALGSPGAGGPYLPYLPICPTCLLPICLFAYPLRMPAEGACLGRQAVPLLILSLAAASVTARSGAPVPTRTPMGLHVPLGLELLLERNSHQASSTWAPWRPMSYVLPGEIK